MRGVIAAIVVAAGMCGPARGQDEPRPPLEGPAVRERRPPGAEQPFAPGGGQRRQQAAMIPHRSFMEAVRPLRADAESDAPDKLRLTSDQEKRIDELDEDFRETMREYVQKERAGMGGDAPGPDRQSRMEEAIRNAPRAADWHTKMFGVLSEPQQDFVRARLEDSRRRTEERRAEAQMERQVQERRTQPAPAGRPAQAQGGPPPAGRERMRRIAELMSQLPPEEREQLLSRIERELERRVRERGPGAQGGPTEEMDRPPPSDAPAPAPAEPRRVRNRPPRPPGTAR